MRSASACLFVALSYGLNTGAGTIWITTAVIHLPDALVMGCMNDLACHPLRSLPPLSGRWFAAMTDPAAQHAALIQAVAVRADRDAFGALFRHFGPRVKTLLLRSGADAGSAEELAQETMLTVWRKAALFDPERATAATWIFTIARNLRIDARRRERHPDTLLPDPPEEPPGADHLLSAGERGARVAEAMENLPPEQAEIVRAAFFLDQPHAEIERQLGVPLGTVKSRLRLAMAKLRAALEDLA